jgi:alpha-tubulin suppressor-like RCC1 family protein
MSLRRPNGFISAGYDPLEVPNAPTIGTASIASTTSVSVTFTAPSNVGGSAITSYVATAKKTSDGTTISGTGSSSPVTISGLTTGSAYTVTVAAVNSYGLGVSSAASNSVTPQEQQLWSWGVNPDGQLGLNDTANRSSPIQVGALTAWADVSAGYYQSLALKNDGTLWAWGRNNNGQLGLGNVINRSSPVQVGALTNWSQPASIGISSLATKTDGTLWAWGWNNFGQLGQNNTTNRSSPVQVGALTTWSKVAECGGSHVNALKTDGSLWAWGNNYAGELGLGNSGNTNRSSPVQVGALTNWYDIASGAKHSLAIKTDGTLWAWGRNNTGQLGIGLAAGGDAESRSSPVQVGALTTWSKVAGGYYSSFAIKTDGTLWCWGSNFAGGLGLGDVVNRSSPVQVGALTNWSGIFGNNFSILAIKNDGTLWAWGQNNTGGLGLGDANNRSSPVQVGALMTWQRASAGANFSLAIKG